MEVPHLNGWYQRFREQGLVVIGLSTAPPETQREFARQRKIAYPLFLWEREKMPPLFRPVVATPTTVVIDRNGVVREVFLGILFGEEKEAFERRLRQLVAEKPKQQKPSSPAAKKEPSTPKKSP